MCESLVINKSPKPREDLRLGALFSDGVVCLMRAGHPLANEVRIELAPHLGMQHLAPHPSSLRELGPVNGELAKVGSRRTIAATVPEFNLVPYVLLRTDLVFTTGRRFAEHCAQRMAHGGGAGARGVTRHALLPAVARAQARQPPQPVLARTREEASA